MVNPKHEVTSTVYLKLAKTCRSIGELDLAISVCEKGVSRFSQDSLLYNIKGESHVLKFNKNKNPSELKLALKCFETSLTINPHNYLAKLLAGQIYIRGKAYNKAKEKLNSILRTAPDDTAALKLFKELKKRERAKLRKETETDKSQSGRLETEGVPIEETSSVNYKYLIRQLPVFKRISGIRGLFLMDRYGMVIRNINKSKIEGNLLSAISANIFRSSQSGVQRLGLGKFKNGMFMSPKGNFYIIDAFGAVLLILTTIETNQKDVDDAVNDYLAQVQKNINYRKRSLYSF